MSFEDFIGGFGGFLMKYRVCKKNKVLIGIIIAVYAILMLVLASIILEGTGCFVGEWLNRPAVDSYISKHYKGLGYKVTDTYFKYETEENYGFNVKTKGYIYKCKVTSVKDGQYGRLSVGDTFLIKSYNFKVYYDQIFLDYNLDAELSDAINEKVLSKYKDFFSGDSYRFEPFEVYADTMPSYNEFQYDTLEKKVDAAISSGILGRGTLVLRVRGNNIGYNEYRQVISYVVDIANKDFSGYDKNYVPGSLQVIYYYADENGNDVAIYESRFESSELNFSRDVAANANGIHYKMKPSDSEVTQYKVYSGFRLFYIIMLLVVVVGLSLLWVVRKVRKLMKEGRIPADTVENEAAAAETLDEAADADIIDEENSSTEEPEEAEKASDDEKL